MYVLNTGCILLLSMCVCPICYGLQPRFYQYESYQSKDGDENIILHHDIVLLESIMYIIEIILRVL